MDTFHTLHLTRFARRTAAATLLALALWPAIGLTAPRGPVEKDYDWWRAARFGIFVSWAPSSVLEAHGGSWCRDKDYNPPGVWKKRSTNKTSETVPKAIADGSYKNWRRKNGIPQEIYDNLFHVFDPLRFDAEAWADTFEKAGAKYVVLVTKHHDGFCMFATEQTDYNIMNTPFGRDVAKELSEACHRHGIDVLWYYSAPDWYDPRFNLEDIDPYVDFVAAQMDELFGNYEHIRGVWWDGGLKCDSSKIYEAIYRHVDHPIFNVRGFRTDGVRFGTPEQKLGAFNMKTPWEACACITDCHWFWNGGRGIKSPGTCLRMLIDSAGGDGNLLLDFGPTPEGTIHPPIRDVYLAMGKWLKQYGESIYGTRGGPYTMGTWGCSTRSGKTVYLHVTQIWPDGRLTLPPLPERVVSAKALGGGVPRIKQSKDALEIFLDPKFHRRPDTIIALELNRPALELPVVKTPLLPTLSYDASVSASSEISRFPAASVVLSPYETGEVKTEFGEEPAPRKRKKQVAPETLKKYPWLHLHRGHFWRYWSADPSDERPWLQLDFGRPTTFRRIVLQEKNSRIDAFELQIPAENGTWTSIYEGTELGPFSLRLPNPITTDKIRLQIVAWHEDGMKEGPGIHLFDLYEE